MFSPYEELEYLADYLPEEGETVLVSRQSGELVCKPFSDNDLRDGVDDAELYGLLVQANERLHTAGSLPLWMAVIVLVWTGILVHGVWGLGWQHWYLVPGLSFLLMFGALHWAHHRQSELFRLEILPQLTRELCRRRISPLALIAGVRQHGELRTLLDELVRWTPERNLPLT